ncbi:CoA transferase, partial [Methylibium sp.]|uniref:CoA transferase n=1 Tax=Methylibium sp. TaxID=2067992 RepID=UPI0018157750
MTDPINKGPLAGVKVLELAQIMAGPTCGTLLADMGADVIKVEKLPGGDDTRRYAEPQVNGESAAFMVMNRNKRSIAVNLKTDGGKEVVKRMVAGA